MAKAHISGSFTVQTRSDCAVRYVPKKKGGISISIKSKVESLYGESIKALAEEVLNTLKQQHCELEIQDAGALPFVLAARIEAAVKSAHPEIDMSYLPDLKDHAKLSSSKDRLRRTRLYLPGNQPKYMLNVGIHKPDGVVLDLEDSVALEEKPSARLIIRNALRVLDFFSAERMVRINEGDLGLEDLEFVVPHNVHLVMIPKIETANRLLAVQARCEEICSKCGRKDPVLLMPIVETAKGLLNAPEIAAASPNIAALAIGIEDYTANIHALRTTEGKESFFARSMVVNAARAAGIQPLDSVFSDVSDLGALKGAALESRHMGFDGRGCIHPRQIRVVHEAFMPSDVEISQAKRIILALQQAEAEGRSVVSLGSKMIDPPVVKRAEQVIELSVSFGLLDKNWKSGAGEV